MAIVETLKAALVAAITRGDLDTLRTVLVDLTDEATASPGRNKDWYIYIWDRLCEFDYGHIDTDQLTRDLGALLAAAPQSGVVTAAQTQANALQGNWRLVNQFTPSGQIDRSTTEPVPA